MLLVRKLDSARRASQNKNVRNETLKFREDTEIDMENIFNDTVDDFVCDYCGKEFLCKKSLISHQISHRDDGILTTSKNKFVLLSKLQFLTDGP